MILKCTCNHKYQDKHYGPGMRVHNKCTKDGKVKHRCTVCSDVKESGQSQPSEWTRVQPGVGS